MLATALLLIPLPEPPRAEPAPPDDESCPYCLDDPERLAAIGAVSHGPFPIADGTSTELAEMPSGHGWRFLETEHLRFASNLGPGRLNAELREDFADELELLRSVCPEVPERPRRLDPWLRLHVQALLCEQIYDRFQEIVQVEDADFPTAPRRLGDVYMGNGPFLGELDKYEVVYHNRRTTHQTFTRTHMGFVATDALRWHFSPQHKHTASIPAEDSDLASDEWLHPHTAHLLTQMFLAGFKDFSYDPPVWMDVGLAHMVERSIKSESTTLEGDEGGAPHRGDHLDWTGRDKRMSKKRDAPNFARLLAVQTYGQLDLELHIAAWSYTRFLVEEHPDEYAQFVGAVKAQLDENQMPTGRDLVGLQRRLLRELWDWTPAQLDEAWREWVAEQ